MRYVVILALLFTPTLALAQDTPPPPCETRIQIVELARAQVEASLAKIFASPDPGDRPAAG